MSFRFYRALTAEARAARGEFSLLGRQLRVFSLMHWAVLEEAIGMSWLEGAPDLAQLDYIAHVCAQECPDGTPAERLDADIEVLQVHDPEVEVAALDEYLHWCWDSRPRIMRAKGGKSADWRAPDPLVLATYIQRHLDIDPHVIWTKWSVARVHWQFEAIREQTGEYSLLCRTDEPAPEPTAEEKEAKLSYQEMANKIIRACGEKRVKLGKKPLKGRRKEMAMEIDAEQARLFALLRAGRLEPDLTEIPAP